MSLTSAILVWGIVALVGGSFHAHADRVDDIVQSEMKKQHIPGLALAVAKRGELVKTACYGLANVELGVPVQTGTVFQIQSVTKTFTAAAIILLIEEGKLCLDDKISKHLADLPESWEAVTVRHLLSHTSGIKDFINEPTVDLQHDIKPNDVIKSLLVKPLTFQPGEQYAYSNTGYHLLGMIIHAVTGKHWGEFVQERILDPLGMHDTRVISLSDIITNRAAGYVWENDQLKNGRFIAPTIVSYAGGGLCSTVLDLAKWDAALYTEKILRRSSLQQMWTPAKLNDGSSVNYGLGWVINNVRGHRLVSHAGSLVTGFTSIFARFLDDNLTVIILSNQQAANLRAIAMHVAANYIAELRQGPGTN